MKKNRARLLALMLAVSMVVPNGTGMNAITVQAEEAVITNNEQAVNYVEVDKTILGANLVVKSEAKQWGPKEGIYDDDLSNFWHSGAQVKGCSNENAAKDMDPDTFTETSQWIQTGFGRKMQIGKVVYRSRPTAVNGSIAHYEVQIANLSDVTATPTDNDFSVVAKGLFRDTRDEQEIILTPIEATHVRLVAKSVYNNNGQCDNHVAVSRFRVFEVVSTARAELASKIASVEKDSDKVANLTDEEKVILATAKTVANTSGLTDAEYFTQIENLRNIWTEYRVDDSILIKNIGTNSEHSGHSEDGPAAWAFDDENRWWHTKYSDKSGTFANNNGELYIQTGFEKQTYVSKLTCLPRDGGGKIKDYTISVANVFNTDGTVGTPDDNTEWTVVDRGQMKNAYVENVISWDNPVAATHIRITATSSHDGTQNYVVIKRIKIWETDKRQVLKDRIDYVKNITNDDSNLAVALTDAEEVYNGVYTTSIEADAAYTLAINNLDAARKAAKTFQLNETAITLEREQSNTLVAIVPELYSWEKNVTWATDNASVATVDADGKVTAVSVGTANITATLEGYDETLTCAVTVVPKIYQITAVSADNNKGTVQMTEGQQGKNNENTQITVVAVPSDGFVFTNWTDGNGQVLSIDANYTFTVTQNTSLTANFEADNQLKLEAFSMNGNDNVTLEREFYWGVTEYTGFVTSTKTAIAAKTNYADATISVLVDGKEVTSGIGELEDTIYLPATIGGVEAKPCLVTLVVTRGEESKAYTFNLSTGVKYLSDLEWESATNGYGGLNGIGKDTSHGKTGIGLKKADGTEQTFEKGIGVHASSEIVYNISSMDHDVFEAYVGIDKAQRGNGNSSVTFKVYVDGVEKYNSGEMKSTDVMQHVVITGLANASKLKLVADAGENINNDHADWADAKLTHGFVASTESVTLDKEELTVILGTTETLTATTTPVVTEETNRITWTSSNEAVATVNNGVVTPVASGQATITVTTEDGNTDTCVVTVKEEFSVVLGSVVNGTKTESIANLVGGGTYYTGDTVTVTAPAKVGYDFVGWFTKDVAGTTYAVENALSIENTYTFTATTKNLVAVYTPDAERNVELIITDTTKVTVTGAENYETGVKAGTEVTVTYADAANFLYWKNASGKVVSTKASYTFTVVNNTTLTPVAKAAETGSALVEFVNEYDQVLSVSTWAADGEDALSTTTPSKLGYTFSGWAFESAPKTVVDAAAVRTAITGGATYVTLVPVYTKAENTECNVTYNNGDGEGNYEVTVALGETYTVTAATVPGQKFSHWAVQEENGAAGAILSYNESYTFLVTGNVKLMATFVEESTTVEKTSILDITSQYTITNAEGAVEKVAFVASREIAEGYTLLEHGMLYAKDSAITNAEAFVEGVAGVNKFTASGTGMKGALTLNVRLGEATSIKVRAYAIVMDTEGNVTTLYSDMATYTK